MQDPLKRAFPGRVAEYYRSKVGSVQVSVPQKDLPAKLAPNFSYCPQ